MVDYTDWTKIAFQLAADDVSQQRVIQRAANLWNRNKSRLKTMNMAEAREFGRREL